MSYFQSVTQCSQSHRLKSWLALSHCKCYYICTFVFALSLLCVCVSYFFRKCQFCKANVTNKKQILQQKSLFSSFSYDCVISYIIFYLVFYTLSIILQAFDIFWNPSVSILKLHRLISVYKTSVSQQDNKNTVSFFSDKTVNCIQSNILHTLHECMTLIG